MSMTASHSQPAPSRTRGTEIDPDLDAAARSYASAAVGDAADEGRVLMRVIEHLGSRPGARPQDELLYRDACRDVALLAGHAGVMADDAVAAACEWLAGGAARLLVGLYARAASLLLRCARAYGDDTGADIARLLDAADTTLRACLPVDLAPAWHRVRRQLRALAGTLPAAACDQCGRTLPARRGWLYCPACDSDRHDGENTSPVTATAPRAAPLRPYAESAWFRRPDELHEPQVSAN
jgi:hypothetical protein